MDDQNKKNPYDDFFSESGDSDKRHRAEDDNAGPADRGSDEEQKQSYYYSYGPFKSGSQQRPSDGYRSEGKPAGDHDYPEDSRYNERVHAGSKDVLVTPPRQVRPFAPTQQVNRDGWKMNERKGSPFRAMFASFLVGVLLVGSLMFASDKFNWFTGNEALSASAGTTGTNVTTSGKASTAADTVRPNNIAQISEKSSPAVVLIETYVKQSRNGGGNSMFNDPFFQQFFGDQYGSNEGNGGNGSNGGNGGNGNNGGQLQELGIGSGFFFESDGYILTNQHVVAGSDEIRVKVQGYDKAFTAKLMGTAKDLDLAVLKVENTGGKPFPTLPLGDSDASVIGDWVVAIGNPNGFDHTVTVGVVSAKGRQISIPDEEDGTTRNYTNLLQTDASINPGNSGGPLINMNGEVVGINTAISSSSQGIGFAIPTTTIKEVVDRLKNNENVTTPRPFIGAELRDITDAMAQQLGLSSTDGSIVSNVQYKTPAYDADLRQYDVITGLDGTKISTKEALIEAIQKKSVGDKVTLNIIRNGKAMDLTVTIGNRNDYSMQ
ncbi:S1C family serine protease [Paenibacillus beijingensis]|uniref:PDZ domain-containing protein n=1 Tax=Paenibacillus beijingensis TaxID=1126833 RepID=A0A0D5NLF2_9BACL|nr:trypsin-like peptidase domain-containing protein [Paenibacillus beijingensis]AJY75832.1 hypothetical protein VN24_16315 [Paenibacillus beijingensis]